MDTIESCVKKLDVLPLAKHYMDALELGSLFEKYIPKSARMKVAPSEILSVIVLNILCATKPLYKVEEWFADYTDGLGEQPIIANNYNDDRLARDLDRLFDADRHSIMTELSSRAIKVFNLETSKIHNDSTTVTFKGRYSNQDSNAVNLCYGHNKDFRPDCKQIVFGLNIIDDGHVPLSFQLYDGNQSDDPTHAPNWDELRKLLAKQDFIYVADCKLCNSKNLSHIHSNGGKFVTIIPKNQLPAKNFLERLKTEQIEWKAAYSIPNSRKKSETVIYRTFEDDHTKEGYRVIWVHSSEKARQDQLRRQKQLDSIDKKLSELAPRLNRCRLKKRSQIEAAIKKILTNQAHLYKVKIIADIKVFDQAITPGRPGINTQYKKRRETTYHLDWTRSEKDIKTIQRTDGVFPLITNTSLQACKVLQIYKKQPYLEKRMYSTKSVLEVAPVFIKKSRRIEAMLFLYFVSLVIISLIERNIRKQMRKKNIEKISILPQGMKTAKPTWNNIRYFFRNIHMNKITSDGKILQKNIKGINDVHKLVLDLLSVPISTYPRFEDDWSAFY